MGRRRRGRKRRRSGGTVGRGRADRPVACALRVRPGKPTAARYFPCPSRTDRGRECAPPPPSRASGRDRVNRGRWIDFERIRVGNEKREKVITMHIRKIPFNQLSGDHFKALVKSGTFEDANLEFKQEPYGKSDSDVKELCKDVSAFANGSGGDLIIGIIERDSHAESLATLAKSDIDIELQRIDNITRSGIQPKIPNLQMNKIEIEDGWIIIVRVPRSPAAPHRVSYKNSNRFFIRDNQSVSELTMDELRRAFLRRNTNSESLKNFFIRRESVIGDFYNENFSENRKSPYLFYHIILDRLIENRDPYDISELNESVASLIPAWSSGFRHRINADGIFISSERENKFGYTQVFRGGGIECTSIGFFEVGPYGQDLENPNLSARYTEKYLPSTLLKQILQLVDPEIDSAVFLRCGIIGAKDRYIQYPPGYGRCSDLTLDRNYFQTPEVVIYSFDRLSIIKAIQSLMDHVWNGFGYKCANPVELYDQNNSDAV